MRSVAALAFFTLALAGCLGVDSPDGALKCSDVAQRACPAGFYCLATDDTCWRFGHYPDMGVIVPPKAGPQLDFSFPVEDDLSVGPPDLLQSD